MSLLPSTMSFIRICSSILIDRHQYFRKRSKNSSLILTIAHPSFHKPMHLQFFAVFNRASFVLRAMASHARRPCGSPFPVFYSKYEHRSHHDFLQVLCLLCRYFDFEAASGMDESQHRCSSNMLFVCCTMDVGVRSSVTHQSRYRIPVAPEKGMWLNVKLRA
jgi:hypothetical protein